VNRQNPTASDSSTPTGGNANPLQLNSNSSRRAVGAPSLSGMPQNGEPMNGFSMGGPNSINNGT